jgi:hypothetical protein
MTAFTISSDFALRLYTKDNPVLTKPTLPQNVLNEFQTFVITGQRKSDMRKNAPAAAAKPQPVQETRKRPVSPVKMEEEPVPLARAQPQIPPRPAPAVPMSEDPFPVVEKAPSPPPVVAPV